MRAEIREALRCIGFNDVDASTAIRNRSLLVELLPDVIKEFYDHLFSIGHGELFRAIDVERLKARQLEHWRRLFRAEFDDVYANHVTRIGVVHRDNQITPKVYMQAYGWFTSRLVERIVDHPEIDPPDRSRLAAVVLKLIHLDMTMALASYDAALID